ncbi:hypothetical protein GQ43DRAFT_485676, partial [Delitschia confertaspora ATCC 74209]
LAPIEDALADIESLPPREEFSYTIIADKHGVRRSILTRRHQAIHGLREVKAVNQRDITLQQEERTVKYIEELRERHLPPTRQMIKNFASTIAKKSVSERLVTRFLNRNKADLTS